MSILLDGKSASQHGKRILSEKVKSFSHQPHLVIIQVGSREDSISYIKQKQKFGQEIGVRVEVVDFPTDISLKLLKKSVERYSQSKDVDGIIVQLPLPSHISEFEVIEKISPEKDVDGLTALNTKKLQHKEEGGFVPATAKGVVSFLRYYDIPIAGRKALVIGRSKLVGRPILNALLAEDATVTVAHSKTYDLASVSRNADILISATGQPSLVGVEHVHENQVVVDVGLTVFKTENNATGKKLVGDVDFESVKGIVSAISPVPGGVGPMTVLSLFENLVSAYESFHFYK